MANIVDFYKEERLRPFDGYTPDPLFEAPPNYSCYHDGAINQQIRITLPDVDTNQAMCSTKNA